MRRTGLGAAPFVWLLACWSATAQGPYVELAGWADNQNSPSNPLVAWPNASVYPVQAFVGMGTIATQQFGRVRDWRITVTNYNSGQYMVTVPLRNGSKTANGWAEGAQRNLIEGWAEGMYLALPNHWKPSQNAAPNGYHGEFD